MHTLWSILQVGRSSEVEAAFLDLNFHGRPETDCQHRNMTRLGYPE